MMAVKHKMSVFFSTKHIFKCKYITLGFELESVSTTQNVYKQTLTTKTHIESFAGEIISIDSDKDHKANVVREIVLPELLETGVHYPTAQYKVNK